MNSLNSAGDAALTIGLGGLVGNALLVGALESRGRHARPLQDPVAGDASADALSSRCPLPPGYSCLPWARSPACAGFA